jgi:hypothetical protein
MAVRLKFSGDSNSNVSYARRKSRRPLQIERLRSFVRQIARADVGFGIEPEL